MGSCTCRRNEAPPRMVTAYHVDVCRHDSGANQEVG